METEIKNVIDLSAEAYARLLNQGELKVMVGDGLISLRHEEAYSEEYLSYGEFYRIVARSEDAATVGQVEAIYVRIALGCAAPPVAKFDRGQRECREDNDIPLRIISLLKRNPGWSIRFNASHWRSDFSGFTVAEHNGGRVKREESMMNLKQSRRVLEDVEIFLRDTIEGR